MNGLDDIGLTLRHADAIDAHEQSRPSYKPCIPSYFVAVGATGPPTAPVSGKGVAASRNS